MAFECLLTISVCIFSLISRTEFSEGVGWTDGFYCFNNIPEILAMLSWAGIAAAWTHEDLRFARDNNPTKTNGTLLAVTVLSYVLLYVTLSTLAAP